MSEVRRLVELHGLGDTPGLAEALATAENGQRVTVTPESELGQQVRAWLAEANRASWSLNDHSARMDEARRKRGFDLGWLARALGDALENTPVRRN